MSDTEIRAQVDAFIALPRAERRVKYATLPREVQIRARKVLEARRGIAYRAQGGDMVLTKEEYVRQILRRNDKMKEMETRKGLLAESIVELKKRLQENYGDEALAEAETALES
jgi:hypothetical protein